MYLGFTEAIFLLCRISQGKLKPSECIKLIHNNYLKRICLDSGLQGLKYHGGPLLPCRCSSPSVFTYVKFDPEIGADDSNLPLQCAECLLESSDPVDKIFAQVSVTLQLLSYFSC